MIRAGIIAAGHGSRLAAGGCAAPKPLIPVAGRPLCHWVVRGMVGAGAAEITLLHNSRGGAIPESLAAAFPDVRWSFLQQDTASSWESFRLVALSLARGGAPFLMSTVDALLAPAEVARFWAAMEASGAAAGLALTDFIDDEKPLWADLSAEGRIAALGDKASARRYATAGLYFLNAETAREMPEAAAYSSLREYLARLADGRRLMGIPVRKAVDVDRPADIVEAEEFIASW